MAIWTAPKTNHTPEEQVTSDLFNKIEGNIEYLNDTKITTGQVQNASVSSTQATTRTNISATETIKSAFGKIRKWFADLKALAFKDTVGTSDIDDAAVTTAKIGATAVTSAKLASSAVTTAKISAGAVTDAKITSVAASKVTGLATVATTGSYSDLKDIPSDVDLSPYIRKADLLNYLYPVGSIRVSTSSTNPGTYLGGTWTQWGAGRVPVGVDTSQTEFSTVEKTGGAKTHVLTVNELPSHIHGQYLDRGGTRESWLYGAGQSSSNVGYSLSDSAVAAGTSRRDRLTTASAGSGYEHNNLQPYITCYLWKRTA